MTKKEQEQWKQSMIETLYPTIRKKIFQEMEDIIEKRVMAKMSELMDFPLTIKQVADILEVKINTIYKWQSRKALTFTKNGKKKYTITLKELNNQLSGRKDLALELSGNHKKPSSTLSRDPVEAANLE